MREWTSRLEVLNLIMPAQIISWCCQGKRVLRVTRAGSQAALIPAITRSPEFDRHLCCAAPAASERAAKLSQSLPHAALVRWIEPATC